MQKTLLLLAFTALTAVFWSCTSDNLNHLSGTKWISTNDSITINVNFANDSICYITTGRNGLLSANLVSYEWRYASNMDSHWGQFHLYDETGLAFSGTLEKKKLLLVSSRNDLQQFWFNKE
ncbi:MAG: hypothetical protein LBN23_02045 [Paludibacter sp.]|jgi:hypothetical protein|nr:hypothetical protein [Paludibacter sp.]